MNSILDTITIFFFYFLKILKTTEVITKKLTFPQMWTMKPSLWEQDLKWISKYCIPKHHIRKITPAIKVKATDQLDWFRFIPLFYFVHTLIFTFAAILVFYTYISKDSLNLPFLYFQICGNGSFLMCSLNLCPVFF